MPSFLVHALIPTFAMLSVRRYFDPRIVLYLWPLTLLPDLDYFGANGTWWVHRATLHSLLSVALVVGLVWLAARRWAAPGAAPQYAAVALVYHGSHILMDTFAGGNVFFWPFFNQTFLYWFYIEVDTATNTPIVTSEPATHEGAPVVSTTYEWLSPAETAMMAFLLVFWAVLVTLSLAERYRDRRENGGRNRQNATPAGGAARPPPKPSKDQPVAPFPEEGTFK
ncbi:MAG TPA: metal-dependent hydrolase [Candidatus Thermoplasmatota archaeon]|nr:metal-dependent hydrolase [Candidatus Thermoplasmatota archaeon]